MKDFDLAAAKRGARVYTREGWPARILCFDSAGVGHNGSPMPIIAEIFTGRGYSAFSYRGTGRIDGSRETCYDLMMADDYIEKLERGEYCALEQHTTPLWKGPHRIMTTKQIATQPFASISDENYWRRMYAGMAMQAIIREDPQGLAYNHAIYAVTDADALIEELKKEKK